MDALKDPSADTVVVMSSAQVGKTEILNNLVGYHVDQDPCPILVLQPTLEMAEAWSKDRLAPMLRDSPSLRDKVRDPQARNSGNTVRHKVFAGGHVTMAGANSPSSLAMRPVRVLACDEVDRYPVSAGTEGDPVSLASKRTARFWNRRRLLTSTPTIKGASRIEAAYNASTMERYHVPCPGCGEYQHLQWSQVKWPEDDPDGAEYQCEHCGSMWNDARRWAALRDGKWVAGAEARTRGFHLNEIYSPWTPLADMVEAFLEARALPETLKTWVNTALGETWEEEGETVEAEALHRQRREVYGDTLPADALLITAGIDQQKNWLVVETVAWSDELESWSLDYREIHGDTSRPTEGAWADLSDYLTASAWKHVSGKSLRIEAAAVDTHGTYTTAAYEFCKRSPTPPRVYAIRGMGGMGKPIIAATSRNNEAGIPLFSLGVDTIKSQLYSRLYQVTTPGPGYCHFPNEYGEDYFTGLASESAITKYRKGRPEVVWTPKPGTRQEPLDCRVYAIAALEIFNPAWAAFRARVATETPQETPQPVTRLATPQTRRPGRRGAWVKSWR